MFTNTECLVKYSKILITWTLFRGISSYFRVISGLFRVILVYCRTRSERTSTTYDVRPTYVAYEVF